MAAREKGRHPKRVSGAPADPGNSRKTEFRVLGKEMIEKKVKTSGKTGRVYLPGNWVGRLVKIIRLD